jgi:hypothetical protein
MKKRFVRATLLCSGGLTFAGVLGLAASPGSATMLPGSGTVTCFNHQAMTVGANSCAAGTPDNSGNSGNRATITFRNGGTANAFAGNGTNSTNSNNSAFASANGGSAYASAGTGNDSSNSGNSATAISVDGSATASAGNS